MFDLDRYLARIGLHGTPTLAELHRAHVSSIPFENLDPYTGLAVSVERDAIADKLVTRRRGGYCFEQNLLLQSALEALGYTVSPLLARVRAGREGDLPAPLTHLLLRVESDGHSWHADAGFGNGTLTEPIPFGVGGPYEQDGWQFRVVAEAELLVLQSMVDGEWKDTYSFSPLAVEPIDIELSNWYVSTHPQSKFVKRLLVTRHHGDGTRTTLGRAPEQLTLRVDTPSGHTDTALAEGDVATVLEERFGLPGELYRPRD